MIGKGIFHTNIAVRDVSKSMKFYQGLFGMEKSDFVDGDLVFLTTPGREDVLTLTPVGRDLRISWWMRHRDDPREPAESSRGARWR
jgi:catechol 2,3-dioxygenase-like lactoylglutathione lyase family enzyme